MKTVRSILSLDIERDVETVLGAVPELDPDWRHECPDGVLVDLQYLMWVVDLTYFCYECADDHEEGHYKCPRCLQGIDTGEIDTRTPEPVQIVTAMRWTATTEQAGLELLEQVLVDDGRVRGEAIVTEQRLVGGHVVSDLSGTGPISQSSGPREQVNPASEETAERP